MIPTLHIPVGSRSNVNAKAIEIILERRLTVLMCKKDLVYAEVRGTDRIYHPCLVGNRWQCDCEERRGECSHLRALHHVCVRPNA